ncbi:unnamed protein product [Adineta steineri]|uniref:Uncharacterized protein n=4 Tax=Adineta steineri TaxID=433720 RepID=A0A814STS4_9BILA|nr:unnamed protein product [Adineta steineri]
MTLWFISPSSPTGNNRLIELAGIDLWMGLCTNRVFVYPSDLNTDQFKYALSRTLSLCPLVAGRFLLLENDHYFIKMSDNPIPVTYIENTELAAWPTELNVISDQHKNYLAPFIDEIQTLKLIYGSQEEPLLRLKLTCLKQSGEWILGVSWAHVLGDGGASSKFLNALSHFYQNLDPVKPLPVFERRLWREDEADQSLLPMMKYLAHAGLSKDKYKLCSHWEDIYEQLNLSFSGKQLAKLRELAGGNNVTIQDSLSAYICLTLNTHCYLNDAQRNIRRINTYVNFRGISDAIAPAGVIANTIFLMPSDDFDDGISLSHIAKTIRQSILRSRNPKFMEPCLATADVLMRRNARENFRACGQFPNEMIVNSNLRFDWASLVDFGYTDKCRCYAPRTSPLFLRVYRLNPIKNGSEWLPRDRDGAEVAFGIEKELKERFLCAWQKDVAENFSNIHY